MKTVEQVRVDAAELHVRAARQMLKRVVDVGLQRDLESVLLRATRAIEEMRGG